MSRRLSALLVTALFACGRAPAAEPARWPVAEEGRLAAEAAGWAPPDFKRQLAKHSGALMRAVAEAASVERLAPRAAAHRVAAAKEARALAAGIRRHESFEIAARHAGAIVHAAAMAYAPDRGASGPSAFLGFGPQPFGEPESIAAEPLPAATDAERRAAALTLSARLLAWAWKTAGGDASFVSTYPAAKGPYAP